MEKTTKEALNQQLHPSLTLGACFSFSACPLGLPQGTVPQAAASTHMGREQLPLPWHAAGQKSTNSSTGQWGTATSTPAAVRDSLFP